MGRARRAHQRDRYLVVNPFFHNFGYKAGILACLVTGATIVPQPVFDAAAAMRLIEAERITVLPGAPTIYQTILDHPARDRLDLTSLRLAVTGAASFRSRWSNGCARADLRHRAHRLRADRGRGRHHVPAGRRARRPWPAPPGGPGGLRGSR